MLDIRSRCASIKQMVSDGLFAYEAAVEDVFDDDVDFRPGYQTLDYG